MKLIVIGSEENKSTYLISVVGTTILFLVGPSSQRVLIWCGNQMSWFKSRRKSFLDGFLCEKGSFFLKLLYLFLKGNASSSLFLHIGLQSVPKCCAWESQGECSYQLQ